MNHVRRSVYLLAGLTALLGLAFGLRLYKLDAVPLRGDEAFAVRYWADTPANVIRDQFDKEPHPLGTFLGFWAWKNVAGDSEFAMRYLPLLGNLIGAAAMAALGKRLFRSHIAALLAAALWTVNPFQIWHAQDVRNYALWAGLSPVALWLFLRAIDSNRPRDWTIYILAEIIALYVFFLEAFLLVVQAIMLIIFLQQGKKPADEILRRAVFAWIITGILLIPWLIQIRLLSGSGYEGTTEESNPAKLLSWFLPTLLTGGKLSAPWHSLVPAIWIGLFGLALFDGIRQRDRVRLLLVTWITVPVVLLLITGTRMDIFNPRYLIAITPAMLLVMVQPVTTNRRIAIAAQLAVLIIPLASFSPLAAYYRGEHPKAAHWPTLATYLEARARPGDRIIATWADPAFDYYYHGGATGLSLNPNASATAQLRPELNFYNTIWLIGRSPDAEQFLHDNLQATSFHEIPGFPIMQFRAWTSAPSEIQHPANVTFGEIVRLTGHTIQGPDPHTRAITVLLYWEPLRQTEIDYKVFVHLIGPPHPGPLWDQDDDRPLSGFASTRTWEIGTRYRDPYHLLEDPAIELIPAEYTIQIGFYDPATNARLPVFDAGGADLGDSYPLVTFSWPLTP